MSLSQHGVFLHGHERSVATRRWGGLEAGSGVSGASFGPVLAPGLQHGSGTVCWYFGVYVDRMLCVVFVCRYGTKAASVAG